MSKLMDADSEVPLQSLLKVIIIMMKPYIFETSNKPGGVLPIMAYTGRLRPKGVPFSGFRYIKR